MSYQVKVAFMMLSVWHRAFNILQAVNSLEVTGFEILGDFNQFRCDSMVNAV